MGDPGDYQNLPNVSDQDAEFDEEPDEDSESSDERFPYTTQELADIFTKFYKFLATLHYDLADLKLPPPEGWDTGVLPAAIVDSKSEEVVDLMRHLPYFKENERSTHVHYKSKLLDYTDSRQHSLAKSHDELLEYAFDEPHDPDRPVDFSQVLVIAAGYESGGREFVLDVEHGEITEDVIRFNTLPPVDVRDFFAKLKEEFRSLRLIPCPGRETQEADRVSELDREIAEEEIRAQTEQWYPGTDLDWQFVRQIYRQYGWPHDFRRQEAVSFIDEFIERDKDVRDEWEPAFK